MDNYPHETKILMPQAPDLGISSQMSKYQCKLRSKSLDPFRYQSKDSMPFSKRKKTSNDLPNSLDNYFFNKKTKLFALSKRIRITKANKTISGMNVRP
jgi:hypothetical protein